MSFPLFGSALLPSEWEWYSTGMLPDPSFSTRLRDEEPFLDYGERQSSSAPSFPESVPISAEQSGRTLAQTELAPLTPSPDKQLVRVRRKPIPRKGHTKSRAGCFNCKRRRVKCQETRPSCANCQRAGYLCEYPPKPGELLVPCPLLQPQGTPTIFSLLDMRLFHHFLVQAYPQLPAGADAVWTLQIPAFAHEYDFLMHAMLALGASHLQLTTNSDLAVPAMQHRVNAINALSKVMATPAKTHTEGDARFAAFMAMTFQSCCLPDGYIEFLSMLRGCVLQGIPLGPESVFADFLAERSLDESKRKIIELEAGQIESETIDTGQVGLAAILPLCQSWTEKKYHYLLSKLVENTQIDPTVSNIAFVEVYNVVGIITHAEFQHFINPKNFTARLLMSYFFAAHLLMRDIRAYKPLNERPQPMYAVIEGWVSHINESLPPAFRKHNEWPLRLTRESSARDRNKVSSSSSYSNPRVEDVSDEMSADLS